MTATGNNIGEVSQLRVLKGARFAELADRLLSIAWPVAADGVDALLEEWHWVVEERVGDDAIVVDAGYGFDRPDPGWVYLRHGEVNSISLAISDPSPGRTLAPELRDAFAEGVATISDRVGAPTERKTGKEPIAVWVLPSGVNVVLYAAVLGNILEITSPAEGRARQEAP